MSNMRKIEIFSADCPLCRDTIKMITSMECPSCEITVLDIHNEEITERVKKLHIGAVPAVVIDGKLSSCCINKGPKLETLRAEGIGVPL